MLRQLLHGVCFACTLGVASPHAVAQAAPMADSRTRLSQSQTTADAVLDERQARDWGLRPEEWSRYREVMHGPLGTYSPQLDPLTALGIEARSDDERRHYAELQARAEAARVEKVLAYQRAYDAAWQRLFPGQPRLNSTGADAPSAGPSNADRLAVFIKANCTPCDERVKQLQAAGASFDLYFVGSRGEDIRIRQWAARAGVDPARVRAGAITLNHDGGRWVSLGLSGELPAVVRTVNGQWQRQ